MILDHANRYLSWDQAWIEQAGRAVFPLFAIVLGLGLRGADGDRAMRMAIPLLVLGAIAQLAVAPLVFFGLRDPWLVNVLATLAVGAVFVALSRDGWYRHWTGVSVLLLGLGVAALSEYGPIGAALVLAAARGWRVVLWLCLGLLSVSQGTIVPLAVPLFVWLLDRAMVGESFRSPKRMFAFAYVGQWLFFGALVALGAQG